MSEVPLHLCMSRAYRAFAATRQCVARWVSRLWGYLRTQSYEDADVDSLEHLMFVHSGELTETLRTQGYEDADGDLLKPRYRSVSLIRKCPPP